MEIKAMEAYGLTECGGPGTAYDCVVQDGLHVNEDHFIAEIIDPVTGEVLPLGQKGSCLHGDSTSGDAVTPGIAPGTSRPFGEKNANAGERSLRWIKSMAGATTCSSSAGSMSSLPD